MTSTPPTPWVVEGRAPTLAPSHPAPDAALGWGSVRSSLALPFLLTQASLNWPRRALLIYPITAGRNYNQKALEGPRPTWEKEKRC